MIIYTKEDTVARVLEITGGEGVSAVYDGVGKDTYVFPTYFVYPRNNLSLKLGKQL